MQGTAQSYLVWELTHSPLATSLPILFFSLPSTLLSLVGGVAADRVDRRKLVLGTQAAYTVQAIVLAGLTLSGRVQIWQIYALALVNGIVMAFDGPGRQALIPSLVSREVLTNAIALNSTAFNASRVFGPPVAGLVYALAGPGWCFALNAISKVAVLYSLWIIRVPLAGGGARRRHLWDDLREGIGYVRANAPIFTILQLVAIVGTFGFTHLVLMPVIASSVLGGGPAENGLLLGAVGFGATLGGLTIATRPSPRQPNRQAVILAYAASAGMLAFALSRHFQLSLVLAAWVGGCTIAFLATSNSTIQASVPDALRGRVMSIYTLALVGSGPLNSLVAGILGSILGAPGAIIVSALILGVAIIILGWRSQPVARSEEPSPASAGNAAP
jgi:MFS family permease